MHRALSALATGTGLAFGLLIGSTAVAQQDASQGEWLQFGGDVANTKYSPLDQIDRSNFAELTIAWRWHPDIQQRVAEADTRVEPGQFKPTPLMVDGVLYLATAVSQVVALDAGSGEMIWSFDPESYKAGRPANVGFQHRGVAYWSDGDDRRIFITTHDRRLIAVNADTGEIYPDFGDNGSVDLEGSLGRKVNRRNITHSSPPGICRDTVVVGSIVFDGGRSQKSPPGHIRGFDARTGEMKWIFHSIPQQGEFGVETWQNESWKYTGSCNVWSMFAADEELGYVYMPTSTPTNDMYGGHRLGDNLFAECLVCVDAETGERIWHFQAVHHGLWDYDFPTAPNLVDVTVDGKPIKAVAQVSKQGFCYVFDRVTGEPLWPIEERPVASSSIPGEVAAATQPFPTKPAAYERQGFSQDDLIDFTPELKAKALAAVKDLAMGPLFTPPTFQGTLGLPGAGGGSNWPGAALDPETGILYVPSITSPSLFRVVKPDESRSNLRFITAWFSEGPHQDGIDGLPLVKPPYSRVTAIDLNTGDHVWMTPHGDGPRKHPAIAHLNLPPLGEPGGIGGPLVTKTLLFVSQRASGRPGSDAVHKLTVFDKQTGEILGTIPLPGRPYGNPITYLHQGKQYISIALGGGRFFGGGGTPPELVAFCLP